jgi:hypothetical protein
VILSYLNETLFAQDNTIVSFLRPTFSYRYTGNGIAIRHSEIITAHSATRPVSIIPALPVQCHFLSVKRKLHSALPPSYTWRKYFNHTYWYELGSKPTGIVIFTISKLRLSAKVHSEYLELARKSFRISFLPDKNSQVYHLVEAPTLSKAKAIAEEYYEKWHKTNAICVTPPKDEK